MRGLEGLHHIILSFTTKQKLIGRSSTSITKIDLANLNSIIFNHHISVIFNIISLSLSQLMMLIIKSHSNT